MKKAAKKTKSSKRRSDDVNVMAFDIVSELTAEKAAKKASKKTRATTGRKSKKASN